MSRVFGRRTRRESRRKRGKEGRENGKAEEGIVLVERESSEEYAMAAGITIGDEESGPVHVDARKMNEFQREMVLQELYGEEKEEPRLNVVRVQIEGLPVINSPGAHLNLGVAIWSSYRENERVKYRCKYTTEVKRMPSRNWDGGTIDFINPLPIVCDPFLKSVPIRCRRVDI